MNNPFLLLLVAYLLGSVPASHLVARSSGMDLTRRGSGNLGATNVYRTLGWKAALPVVLFDAGKGWLPAWLFPAVDTSSAAAWALAYGSAAVLGHVFSIWMGFRGGKGVATGTGVFLAVAPVALLAAVVVWLVLAFTTRIVSLASMAAAVTVAAAVWFPPAEGTPALRAFAAAVAIFVVWTHRANVRRLLRGEEHRFGEEANRKAHPPSVEGASDSARSGGAPEGGS